jgi:hypothetical protein
MTSSLPKILVSISYLDNTNLLSEVIFNLVHALAGQSHEKMVIILDSIQMKHLLPAFVTVL